MVEQQKKKDVAVIQKSKELEISKANLGIQEANAAAAKFEAQAILEKGYAEAKILQAKYEALGNNKEIYLAEMQRDISDVMYRNLRHFNIQMPQNYVNNGASGGGLISNLDVITAFSALGVMEKAQKLTASPPAAPVAAVPAQ